MSIRTLENKSKNTSNDKFSNSKTRNPVIPLQKASLITRSKSFDRIKPNVKATEKIQPRVEIFLDKRKESIVNLNINLNLNLSLANKTTTASSTNWYKKNGMKNLNMNLDFEKSLDDFRRKVIIDFKKAIKVIDLSSNGLRKSHSCLKKEVLLYKNEKEK